MLCFASLPISSHVMALCDGLSHCKVALVFAVLLDLLGGAALLVGVFAPLEVKGRDFGDLLVYTGMTYTFTGRVRMRSCHDNHPYETLH